MVDIAMKQNPMVPRRSSPPLASCSYMSPLIMVKVVHSRGYDIPRAPDSIALPDCEQ